MCSDPAFRFRTDSLDGRQRLLDPGAGRVPFAFGGRYLDHGCRPALAQRRQPQLAVLDDLHGPLLGGVELTDQSPGCHLAEFDARQFSQRLAAILAQLLQVVGRRAQRAVDAALLLVQLADHAFNRGERLASGLHGFVLTTA